MGIFYYFDFFHNRRNSLCICGPDITYIGSLGFKNSNAFSKIFWPHCFAVVPWVNRSIVEDTSMLNGPCIEGSGQNAGHVLYSKHFISLVWPYGLLSFQMKAYKIRKIYCQNQHSNSREIIVVCKITKIWLSKSGTIWTILSNKYI